MSTEDSESSGSRSTELKPDEAFCTSCGETIKEEAEVCPNCGVRQEGKSESSGTLTDIDKRELQKIARKDTTTVMLASFFLTPVGYIMIGKTGLALVNFFTLNYFLLGPFIVPFHTRKIIRESREDLERNGESW
jgi:RNA polymerase subunit RPABC4/transcription elongation factor Spt4